MRVHSLVLLTLLGATAIACGQSTSKSGTRSAWSCGDSDVPGGSVIQCTQSALVIDDSIQMTAPETCEGSTDNSATCSSYECTEGQPGCPSATDSTTTTDATGTTGSGTGSTDTTASTDTTGTTGSGSGTTDTTGGLDNLGGSSPDCTKNNCSAPGQTKKTTTTGDTTTGSSNGNGGANGNGSVNGNGHGVSSQVPAECSYVDACSAGDAAGDDDDSTSTGSSTTTTTAPAGPKHYKCTKDQDGNRTCETLPSCVAGSHPATCGACVPDGESDDCVSPAEGGCWVTGGGFIEGPNVVTGAAPDGHDNFGGNAKPMKDGRIQGHWNHVDHGTGNHAKGVPSYIVCRHVDEPGPGGPGAKKGFDMNQVYFGGPAQWDAGAGWQDGYWFDVVAKDHGEPGSVPSPKNGFMPDTYHFSIRKQDDPTHQASGTLVYETKGTLDGGNIQMHPPNTGHPYTPSTFPSWVSYEP